MNYEIPTIAEAARDIRNGSLSPVELAERMLSRIAEIDPSLNSYITVTTQLALDQAMNAATEINSGHYRGPMHGIPLAYKDNINTGGVLTSCHSKLRENFIPEEDAYAVSRMRQAGAVMLGKLSTHEFALGGPSFDLPWPPAKNPWNTEHFPGGSSSGSGVAVSAGLALGAFGTDTVGSIRMPAAYTGLVGVKPTYGRVSRRGVFPLAHSLDHVGPMAWSSEDCALMLDVMAGYDKKDPASVNITTKSFMRDIGKDLSGVRIGVIRHFWEEANASQATVSAMESALQVFSKLGARLVDVKLPPLLDFTGTAGIICLSEAAAVHDSTLRNNPEDFGAVLRKRLCLGATFSVPEYIGAMRRRRELCEAYALATEGVDVAFTATVSSSAMRFDDLHWFSSFNKPLLTMPFNVTGSPVVATRAGFCSQGLPLSFQLIGKHFEESRILALAHAYEKSTEWISIRPDVAGVFRG